MGFKSKLLNLKDCAINSMIYNTYYNKSIDEKLVYLESRDGLDFTGNIFRIVEELSTGEYGDLKIYVHAKPSVVDKIKTYQKNYDLKIDKIITKEATATEILERAKYIFTDSGIRPKYVKREGQIFVNTWHGTPLKLMGVDNIAEQHRIANVQHSLLSSDYLLYPNDYMKDKMLNSYMIEKIFPGKILLEGYPRNSIFLDENRRDELKSELGLTDKEIFVYMPTYRGILMDRQEESQKNDVERYLKEMDSKLKDDQILYAKLHVLNESKIDFSKFRHVQKFPEMYEVYDILNLADVLITDYSSVFFDFANTKRKIVLFNYDEEDYISYRGFYIPLSELPFPKVQDIDSLIHELNSSKDYDDTDFIDKYCTYDNEDAVKNICKTVFNGENSCKIETIENNKENILIYAGALYDNGITSALLNLLNNVDMEKYNYFISYETWEPFIIENHERIFESFPENVEFLPLRFNLTPTVKEKLDYNKYFLSKEPMDCPKSLDSLFKRSFDKQYGAIDFKIVIDFDGYNKNALLIFTNSGLRNAVWVHSNMIQEEELRSIQNLNILKDVYSKTDNICVVSDSLIKPTREILDSDNIKVVHNLINHEMIIEDSRKEIQLNDDVQSNHPIDEFLSKPGMTFVSMGRFSPEKGHIRLIEAFNEHCINHPDSKLIIMGGRGDLYDETSDFVDKHESKDRILLIKGLTNPMPILKDADLFILSSLYEGWGIVVMEADILEVPVISTDIEGLQWLNEYGGHLVENSKQGILDGMNGFVKNGLNLLDIDYNKYNEMALEEFNRIFK